MDSESDFTLTTELNILNFLNFVYKHNYFNIDQLLGMLENGNNRFQNNEDSAIISQEDVKIMLTSSNYFTSAIEKSISTITQTLLSYIQRIDACSNNKKLKGVYHQSVVNTAEKLKNFFVCSKEHIAFPHVEECTVEFAIALVKLLRDTDASKLSNLHILAMALKILQMFKELQFVRKPILKALLDNLKEMALVLVPDASIDFFESSSCEKYLHTLTVLRDLLQYCVEYSDIVKSKSYDLPKHLLLSVQKLLNKMLPNMPYYLLRMCHECLNLIE